VVDVPFSKFGSLEKLFMRVIHGAGIFRFLVLVLILVFAVPSCGSAGLRGDFSNNGSLTTDDVILLLSWIQSGRGSNGTIVMSLARELMPSISQTLAFFPSLSNDDYNQDGNTTTDDVVFFLAWIQTGRSSNSTLVGNLALELMPSIKGTIAVFPGAALTTTPTTNTAVDTGTGTGTGSGTGTGTGTGASTATTTGASVTISITGIVPN